MSRILKRPMFRKGGSTNEGIMHGIVDRKGYQQGTSKEEILADLRTDAPRDTSMYEMLIGGGLNLVSGAGAGEGLMANVARSYKGPSETYFERQRAAGDYDRKLEQTAGQMAVKHRLNLAEIAEKKKDENSPLYNVYLEQGVEDGMSGVEAQRYAQFHTTIKEELRKKVGNNRVGGVLEFDLTTLNDKEMKKKFTALKKTGMGKFFYDPYDGKFKQLVEKDGGLGFNEFNSVAGIEFTPDVEKTPTATSTSTYYTDEQAKIDEQRKRGSWGDADIIAQRFP